MQRTLNLFDVNGDGIISKDEAEKISLFYKTGSATFSKSEDSQIVDYTISAKKAGKNPVETRTDVIDEKSDNLLYSEYTSFNGKVKEKQTDQYRYAHRTDGSVEEIHDTINSEDKLVKTEESTIDNNGNHKLKRTIEYSDGKTPGEVNAKYTNADGTTETNTYWTGS